MSSFTISVFSYFSTDVIPSFKVDKLKMFLSFSIFIYLKEYKKIDKVIKFTIKENIPEYLSTNKSIVQFKLYNLCSHVISDLIALIFTFALLMPKKP